MPNIDVKTSLLTTVELDIYEQDIKLVGEIIRLKVRNAQTKFDYADVVISKSQRISYLYEMSKRQVGTKAGERLILCCNSINLNDIFEKTIDETCIENGMTIGVAICLKTEDEDTSLLADVKTMQSKSSSPKNKVIHCK